MHFCISQNEREIFQKKVFSSERMPAWNRAFALLLVAGGVMGARKGSTASLLVALAAAAAHADVATTPARALASRTELLLAVLMGLRYLSSGKFMPSGLVSILSFVMHRYNSKFLED